MVALLASFEGTAVFLALAAGLLVPLEQLFPRTRTPFAWRSFAGDVAWFLACVVALNVVVAPLLALVRTSHHEPWRLALAFAGAELGAYAAHRLMHTVPCLWRFHAVHHADSDDAPLTWSRAWRQHPVDVALHATIVALPGVLLGVSLTGFGTVLLFRRLYTGFLHANVRMRFGFLEDVIATPAFHHAHHSTDPRRFNSNYAALLPVLDRVFGTFRQLPPARQARMVPPDERRDRVSAGT